MHFIWMIIIGFIVGLVARMLMPGKDPAGFIVTALLGIIGSIVAGYLGRALGLYMEDEPAGFIMSVIGAILLLVAHRKLTKKDEAVS